MLDSFFASGLEPYPLLWRQHDPLLVALSVLLDVSASIVALHMAALARRAGSAGMRHLALVSGTLALGAGIWAMHFVAMLAFRICAQGSFDPWMTAASIVPSLLASWVALRLLAQPRIRLPALVASGVLVGAGIGAMHYLGMQASDIAPILRYDPAGFALSIVVAVALAVLALWVRFGLRGRWLAHRTVATLAAGLVMGLAITGMHYTGMAAIRFVQPVVQLPDGAMPEHVVLPLAIAVVAATLFLLAVAINASLRYRQMYLQAQASELRQRAVLETAVDGVVLIDGHGTVQSFNPAAERLFGYAAHEVVGRNVNMLMPEPHRGAHDGYLDTHLRTGRRSIIGSGREVEGRHKDGTLLPLRLAVGRVEQPGAPLFVGFLTDLRHYHALQREREQDARQLQALVSNVPGVAFRASLEGGWPMEFVSDAIHDLTGWSAQDFMQGTVLFGQLVHPQDDALTQPELEQALTQGLPYRIEYRIRRRDGATRWVVEHGRGARDAAGAMRWLDGVLLDITDLKARGAEFAGTVAAINRSQISAEFDLQGRLTTANAAYLALMGYTLEQVHGQPHALFCEPGYARSEAYRAFWQQLVRGEFVAGEVQRFGRDGRPVWLHATYNPILDADGQVCKIIKIATDLSARRAMEQDLRAAKERAEAAAAARATFLANMSHEIRTPMNAIIGFTDVLLESSLDDTQRRHLGTVRQASRSMLRLLNDILDTAKLDKGAVALESAPFDLRELCRHILVSLRIGAGKKGLELVLHYAPDVPGHWEGDAFRLQQILVNLVGNAIKFTHQGRVTLQVSGRDGALLVEVSDTGIGMDEATLRRVFEPFAQADVSTTRRYGGTGLGTTIARQLAELMGGQLDAHSRPGQGSTFSVRLPLRAVQGGSAGAALPAVPVDAGPVLSPLRVLAVDDVLTNLELLQLMLQREGHQVVLAHGGLEALQAFQRGSFELVLMDLQMPEIDGLQAAQRMRAWEREHNLPPTAIVALSASVLEQDRRAARAAGMDGFASKPLELQRLRAEVARVLGLPAQAGAVLGQDGAAPVPVVHWERGLRLWGQAAPLRAAIDRFAHDLPEQLAALHAAVAAGDAPALAAGAHRLHGAAANLALAQLQQVAQQLERAALPGGLAPQSWPALLQALQQALERIVALPQPPDAQPAVSAAAPVPASAPAAGAALALPTLDALDALLQALDAGELPRQALQQLQPHLDAPALATLHDALERFEFSAARQQLQALRARLAGAQAACA
ncbi:PAS domain S-box-containing protein [Oryzisolibacter propanilivorax]|uniref:Sensor protein FixL n=1 Tax=Oryzisolibacter propanilivorax TaxID=1527607 RepID=A0A1G9QPU9_9BURK|nr:PAS domain S-box protein [Oryzisolibacter propanilivorax]SDM13003.1 PAS domain S-box-containing protein [Oryzisolibacter propanilivorax]